MFVAATKKLAVSHELLNHFASAIVWLRRQWRPLERLEPYRVLLGPPPSAKLMMRDDNFFTADQCAPAIGRSAFDWPPPADETIPIQWRRAFH